MRQCHCQSYNYFTKWKTFLNHFIFNLFRCCTCQSKPLFWCCLLTFGFWMSTDHWNDFFCCWQIHVEHLQIQYKHTSKQISKKDKAHKICTTKMFLNTNQTVGLRYKSAWKCKDGWRKFRNILKDIFKFYIPIP